MVSSLMANGLAPNEVATWIIGGRLIPVGAQKVRPIVVVDVFNIVFVLQEKSWQLQSSNLALRCSLHRVE